MLLLFLSLNHYEYKFLPTQDLFHQILRKIFSAVDKILGEILITDWQKIKNKLILLDYLIIIIK